MKILIDWIELNFGLSPVLQGKIAGSLFVVFFIWLIRVAALSIVAKNTENTRTIYRWRKTVNFIAFFISAIIVGRIWFEGIASFSTFLGLVSAGIAIALKDPLINLAGWFFIMWWKPFEVEHRIEIGTHRGDVIDIELMQFTLMETGNWVDSDQSTGRVVHIPNGLIFTSALANYSKGFPFIWDEIPIVLTFESDWEKGKKILSKIINDLTKAATTEARKRIKKAAKSHLIYYRTLTPIVYTSVNDSGVVLTMRYLCDPKQRRNQLETIWECILKEFDKQEDLDLAYPTRRNVSFT